MNNNGLIILLVVCGLMAICSPSYCDDVALWLARSCAGEAGFDSGETGECAEIAYVYKRRSEKTKRDYLTIIKQYSAAVKRRKGHPRPWILHLSRDKKKPKRWPSSWNWKRYRDYWGHLLIIADHFFRGGLHNKYPNADHFGNGSDHQRAVKAGWRMLKTPGMKNRFYSVR